MGYFKEKISRVVFNRKWRKKNRHNTTSPVNMFDMDYVLVGKETYGGIYALIFGSKAKLSIGNYCSIAPGVSFIVCADHEIKNISTFPFKVKTLACSQYEAVSKGDIIVGDDVWIGQNAIILSGVTIGQGAVIGAGAVVTKDVPPYAIVGGNPAKIIKYRFNDKMIKELLKIDFGKLDKEKIEKNLEKLYEKVGVNSDFSWIG